MASPNPPTVILSQALRRPLIGRKLLRPHLAGAVAPPATVQAVAASSYAGAPGPTPVTPAIYLIGTAT